VAKTTLLEVPGRCRIGTSPVPPIRRPEAPIRRIAPFFPLSHRVPRVDDQRVLSGIIHVIHNGLHFSAVRLATTVLFWVNEP
jgi:hypothetical protein